MYVWIWRHLPGNLAARLGEAFLLLAAAVAVLVFAVFPWAEPRLPWNNVNVDQPANVNNPDNVDPGGSDNPVVQTTVSPTSTAMIHTTGTPHA